MGCRRIHPMAPESHRMVPPHTDCRAKRCPVVQAVQARAITPAYRQKDWSQSTGFSSAGRTPGKRVSSRPAGISNCTGGRHAHRGRTPVRSPTSLVDLSSDTGSRTCLDHGTLPPTPRPAWRVQIKRFAIARQTCELSRQRPPEDSAMSMKVSACAEAGSTDVKANTRT